MKCASAISTVRNTDEALAEVWSAAPAGLGGEPADLAKGLRRFEHTTPRRLKASRPGGPREGAGAARRRLHGRVDRRRGPRGRGILRAQPLGDPAPRRDPDPAPVHDRRRRPPRPRPDPPRRRGADPDRPWRPLLVPDRSVPEAGQRRVARRPGLRRDGQRQPVAGGEPARARRRGLQRRRGRHRGQRAGDLAGGGQSGLPADRPDDDRDPGRAERHPRAGPPPGAGSPPRGLPGELDGRRPGASARSCTSAG